MVDWDDHLFSDRSLWHEWGKEPPSTEAAEKALRNMERFGARDAKTMRPREANRTTADLRQPDAHRSPEDRARRQIVRDLALNKACGYDALSCDIEERDEYDGEWAILGFVVVEKRVLNRRLQSDPHRKIQRWQIRWHEKSDQRRLRLFSEVPDKGLS